MPTKTTRLIDAREPSLGGFYGRYGKRLVDLFGALLGLMLLSPVLVFVGLAVRSRLGSPVLFKQARAGRFGEPFTVYKFRTMKDARDSQGELLPDAERLTPFGRWLRSTSLDELPELVNVLKGEMSLVGPRPLLLDYLPRYSDRQARRHDVRPGLTGWSQVRGRNAIDWPTRLEQDVWYTENLSLGLDLRILFETLSAVVTKRDIAAEGHATMPPFTGLESTDDTTNAVPSHVKLPPAA